MYPESNLGSPSKAIWRTGAHVDNFREMQLKQALVIPPRFADSVRRGLLEMIEAGMKVSHTLIPVP